ncbi:hypothetical protein PNI0212_00162 [Streptococcus pneumoniae PNI0212]|nr:hypothetical protein PNI0212_00162 [Streptococcus pneumoniae PNI0212]
MKIKEQTRKLAAGYSKQCLRWQIELTKSAWKLAAGCSKQRFEPADGTDVVSSKHRFEVVDRR